MMMMVYITKMFLHNLSQRHVSALSWAIFRLNTFFFARQTIQLAMLCYCYRLDTVNNNNKALLTIWFALQRKKLSTWRWPVEGPKHVIERSYV